MSLDLAKIASQVSGMVARLKAGRDKEKKRLQSALDTLRNADFDKLARKIAASNTTWLVAGIVEPADRHYPAPPLPTDFTVLAADGSHIDVDRHRSTRCYLINTGSVILHYGHSPDAVLDSSPTLYSEDKDLVIPPPVAGTREQPIEGQLLGIKRSVEECSHLSRLAATMPGGPTLALLDGSLIMWNLEAYPEFVTDALLVKGFLSHMDSIMKLNTGERTVAVASYISFPRSTDVVNTLRVALCPGEPVDCDRCPAPDNKACDAVAHIRDRELFLNLLGPGERSALFFSQSSILRQYGPHQVYFFYLRVDDEMARVEVPRWVATDEKLLGLTHALVLDQCRRGQGYPVALAEAHEKAVLTGLDRENFWQLVESSLVEEHLPSPTSAKSQSKRTRWV